MSEPTWLTTARKYASEKEIPGPQHNPLILKWFKAIKSGWFKDDETPWCAAYVGGVLEEDGIRSSRSAAARSYLDWGEAIGAPQVGAIAVFERGAGGHVGFVVGRDAAGNLMILGGNQSNMVKVSAFATGRVLGYRWPSGKERPTPEMPVLAGNGTLSSGEA